MQQFLLFCTMLIITSEAFSEDLHGSQIFKSTTRKYRLTPKHYCYNPDMLKFSMFPVPSAHKLPDYKLPLFQAPTRGRRFKQNNYYARNNRRLHMRKRFRKNMYKQRKRNLPSSLIMPHSFVLNSPQCFATSGLLYPGCRGGPSNNSCNNFDYVNDFTIENPNQFIVCFYPVFNQFNKRTLDPSKRLRFSPLKRQCSSDVNRVIKNKRSATSKISFDDTEFQIDKKKIVGSENRREGLDRNRVNLPEVCENLYGNCDGNLALSQPKSASHVSFNQPNYKTPQEKKKGKHHEENINSEKEVNDSPVNVNLTAKEKLQDFSRKFVPPLPSGCDNKLAVTQSPPALTKVTVKYQTDVNLYESPVRKEDDFIPPSFETDVSDEMDDTLDEQDTSAPYNITKLKKMLEDVESLLGKNDRVNIYGFQEKDTDAKQKTTKETTITAPKGAIDVKKKIDTEALPILQELSRELENISLIISSISTETNKTKKKGKFFAKLKKKFKSKKKLKATDKEKDSDHTIEHCKAEGKWKSTVLGFELSFRMMPNMMLKVEIVSPGDTVINNRWSIHGLSLSKEGGPFMLGAIYPQKRKLASFIGQCKICKNQELIFGVWTIYTCGRRFTDIWRAVETRLDILKKS